MKKKALLLNTSFYPNIGGVENSLRSIASQLSNTNWHVDIVTSLAKDTATFEKVFGANVYRYDSKGVFPYIFSAYNLIKKLGNNYDLVICRHHVLVVILKYLGFNNIKYIVPGVYKYQNEREKKLSLRSKLKYLFNVKIQEVAFNSSNLFIFSESMKSQIESITGPACSMTKVNPGVDENRFYKLSDEGKKSLRLDLDLEVNKTYILGLGRFVDVKNFEILIEAISYLPENFSLILVGDGYLKDNYRDAILRNSLENRVILLPATTTPEIYYQVCDLFCLSSIYEPFGQVLLEATCSGLPIVAFDSNCLDTVDTATREIYHNYPSLVNFCQNMDAKSLSDSLFLSTKKHLNKSELNHFIASSSWSGFINKVYREKL